MSKYKFRKKALIILEDGTVFFGKSIGFEGTSFGELCFNTGMTGYQEIFTDPSYYGQLMVTTKGVRMGQTPCAHCIYLGFDGEVSLGGFNQFVKDYRKLKIISL